MTNEVTHTEPEKTAASPFQGEGATSHPETGVILADSVTRFRNEAEGAVIATGSHAGVYPAHLVARAGAKGVIFNDASVGKDGAGIAGLALLANLGIPAAAVHYRSAKIGTAHETIELGVVTFVNGPAIRLGCRAGQSAQLCASHMEAAHAVRAYAAEFRETRALVIDEPEKPRVWALDSVSLVREDDCHDVLVTGSHGALLGGRPETALKRSALAVVYNDAGAGPDSRGRTRLAALEERGIAAATVFAASARIGDGRSIYDHGHISSLNEPAALLGAREGMTTKQFVRLIVDRE